MALRQLQAEIYNKYNIELSIINLSMLLGKYVAKNIDKFIDEIIVGNKND